MKLLEFVSTVINDVSGGCRDAGCDPPSSITIDVTVDPIGNVCHNGAGQCGRISATFPVHNIVSRPTGL